MRHTVRAAAAAILACTLLLGTAACTPQGKPEVTPSAESVQPAVTVEVVDNRYIEPTVTIKAGEAVRWEFLGRAKHDVVAEDGSFVSELMSAGSFTHVFTKPGTYKYICSIHPEMVGTVIVK